MDGIRTVIAELQLVLAMVAQLANQTTKDRDLVKQLNALLVQAQSDLAAAARTVTGMNPIIED